MNWIRDNEKTLLESSFMKILERNCHADTDGRKHRFWVLESRDWCNIIPITQDKKIVMVRQHRAGIFEQSIELPGGVLDPGEDAESAGLRELTEETGYEPVQGARVENLSWVFPNPAIQNNRAHLFIVGPVVKSKAQALDPGEMIEVVEVPIEELPERILSGEIRHSIILNSFFFLWLRGHPEGLKQKLTEF